MTRPRTLIGRAHRWAQMARRSHIGAIGLLASFTLSACVPILQQNQPGALETAISRAKFELNCPSVEATLLSQKTIEGIRFEGTEYTIGVRGCGKQAVYLTYCRDADDCNAIAQTDRVEAAPALP